MPRRESRQLKSGLGRVGCGSAGCIAAHIVADEGDEEGVKNRVLTTTDVLAAARVHLGLEHDPELFEALWCNAWGRAINREPKKADQETSGWWEPSAEEAREVLGAIIDGRITDALEPRGMNGTAGMNRRRGADPSSSSIQPRAGGDAPSALIRRRTGKRERQAGENRPRPAAVDGADGPPRGGRRGRSAVQCGSPALTRPLTARA